MRYLFDNSVERMENTCATDLYFDYEAPPKPGDVGISSYGSSFSITLTPQASHTLALLHELKVLDEMVTEENYALAIAKGQEDLVEFVNQVIEKNIENGTIDKLLEEHTALSARLINPGAAPQAGPRVPQ